MKPLTKGHHPLQTTRSWSRSLLCLIKELELSYFGSCPYIVEWCGGWKVTQQDEACQRANELTMSQRLACSWCCKASCFISSHLAYVRGKGLKRSGRESEAHGATLPHVNPIHVQVTEISYPLFLKALSQRACEKAAGAFTATGSCGQNTLGSFATGLKEWWSSASPLNV